MAAIVLCAGRLTWDDDGLCPRRLNCVRWRSFVAYGMAPIPMSVQVMMHCTDGDQYMEVK